MFGLFLSQFMEPFLPCLDIGYRSESKLGGAAIIRQGFALIKVSIVQPFAGMVGPNWWGWWVRVAGHFRQAGRHGLSDRRRSPV